MGTLLEQITAGYGFSGRYVGSQTDKFRDVVGVAVDDAGRILLGHKLGISVFDPKGTFMRIVSSTDPSAFFIEGPNRIVSVRRDQFVPEGAPGTPIGVPVPGKLPREVEEIPAVVTLTNGDRIVVDRQGKGVIRVSPLGKFLGNFAANFNGGRIARNTLDDVAMIDRDGRGIVIADRDGRVTSRIAQKGTGYAFENPLDVGFDPLGHLYVLDSKQAIFVFGPRNRLIATFSSVGSRDAGALQRPKAFAVDAAGRAYVFDEAAQRIQVYQ